MSECTHDRRFHLYNARNGCCACEIEHAARQLAATRSELEQLKKTVEGLKVRLDDATERDTRSRGPLACSGRGMAQQEVAS